MRRATNTSRDIIRMWRRQYLPSLRNKGWNSKVFFTALQSEIFTPSQNRDALNMFLKIYIEGWDYNNPNKQVLSDFLKNEEKFLKKKIVQFIFKNASKVEIKVVKKAKKLSDKQKKVDTKLKENTMVCYGADVETGDIKAIVDANSKAKIVPKFVVNFESEIASNAYDSLLTINSMIGMSVYSYINSLGIKEIPIDSYKKFLSGKVKQGENGILEFSHIGKGIEIRKRISALIDEVVKNMSKGETNLFEIEKYEDISTRLTKMFKNLVTIDTEHLRFIERLTLAALNNANAIDKVVMIESNMKASGIVKAELDSEAINAIEDIRKRVEGSLMEKQLGVIKAGTFTDNDS